MILGFPGVSLRSLELFALCRGSTKQASPTIPQELPLNAAHGAGRPVVEANIETH